MACHRHSRYLLPDLAALPLFTPSTLRLQLLLVTPLHFVDFYILPHLWFLHQFELTQSWPHLLEYLIKIFADHDQLSIQKLKQLFRFNRQRSCLVSLLPLSENWLAIQGSRSRLFALQDWQPLLAKRPMLA